MDHIPSAVASSGQRLLHCKVDPALAAPPPIHSGRSRPDGSPKPTPAHQLLCAVPVIAPHILQTQLTRPLRDNRMALLRWAHANPGTCTKVSSLGGSNLARGTEDPWG